MRIDSLTAVDVHVHIEADGHGCYSLDDELLAASAKYFRADHDRSPTLEKIADLYRSLHMAAVVFTVDAGTFTGHTPLSSAEIADKAREHADVLIPFGSVDPLRGAAAVAQARTLVTDHGVRGFKFHPSLQGFAPDNAACYPLWAEIESLGVPALFHTGQTGIGAGLPGGRGIKLRLSDPMLLDDVAADFPSLTVILAHPSVPWAESAISMATHKSNVYIDLSGWSPKYFPPALVRAANSYLQDKVLFGTDFPLLTPERWLRDFETLDLKPDVRPKILKDNAVRVLGLGVDLAPLVSPGAIRDHRCVPSASHHADTWRVDRALSGGADHDNSGGQTTVWGPMSNLSAWRGAKVATGNLPRSAARSLGARSSGARSSGARSSGQGWAGHAGGALTPQVTGRCPENRLLCNEHPQWRMSMHRLSAQVTDSGVRRYAQLIHRYAPAGHSRRRRFAQRRPQQLWKTCACYRTAIRWCLRKILLYGMMFEVAIRVSGMENGQPSVSALMAAAARAAHLIVDAEPRIFADTLAGTLLGDRATELVSYHTLHGTHPVLVGARTQVTCRSRYTEDTLGRAVGRGVTQYVILGAGLDTFAYRAEAAAAGAPVRLRVFEVDHQATQDWKRRSLAAASVAVPDNVTFVPADLAADSLATRLAAAGFDAAAPALVSWLGVTMYLTRDAIAATLAAVAGFAPGTELVADYMLPEGLRDDAGADYATLVSQASAERGEPWLSSFAPHELTDLALHCGFAATRHVRQRDTIPARLWTRADSLRSADLAVLLHGTVGG